MVVCHVLAHDTTWQTNMFRVSMCKAINLSDQNLCYEFVLKYCRTLGRELWGRYIRALSMGLQRNPEKKNQTSNWKKESNIKLEKKKNRVTTRLKIEETYSDFVSSLFSRIWVMVTPHWQHRTEHRKFTSWRLQTNRYSRGIRQARIVVSLRRHQSTFFDSVDLFPCCVSYRL